MINFDVVGYLTFERILDVQILEGIEFKKSVAIFFGSICSWLFLNTLLVLFPQLPNSFNTFLGHCIDFDKPRMHKDHNLTLNFTGYLLFSCLIICV